MKSKATQILLWVIWLALLIWGATGVIHRLTEGRELANYGSYVPWGLWVAAYIYFIGLSAGAFLLSCLIYVFGMTKLERIGRLALFTAALTLPMALICIWFDLGHMWRNYEVFTRPNWTSMMAWMVWLYSAYFVLILIELYVDLRRPRAGADPQAWQRRKRRILRVLGSIGVPLAFAFHGGVGALFATLGAKPMWHTGLFPILFLTGALVSGGALILAVVSLLGNFGESQRVEMTRILSRIVLALLLFDLLLEWAEFSIPMWYGVGPEYEALMALLFGDFWWVFWIFHMLLGSVIPVILLIAKPTSRGATLVAGGLIAVTFMAVRLNIVIPGQVLAPTLKGLADAYQDARLQFSYMPSVYEWSVVAFVVAAGIGAMYVGKKLLPLTKA